MNWDVTEPSRGTFTYSEADSIVSFAKANGQQIRGYALVWHNQLPTWVLSGSFANATLVSISQDHVTNLVTHFKGKVKTWDVTNEIFNDDGTWRPSVFYRTIGEYFVDIAFKAAEAADPEAGLAANDYGLEEGGAKFNAYINLITNLKSRGVKITQIGCEAHLIVGSTLPPYGLWAAFSALAATGVDVVITQLDTRMTLPATSASLAQQKQDYNAVVSTCAQMSKCVGITLWGYSYYYSPIPSEFPGQGAALPWDDQLVPKPAFYGISGGL